MASCRGRCARAVWGAAMGSRGSDWPSRVLAVGGIQQAAGSCQGPCRVRLHPAPLPSSRPPTIQAIQSTQSLPVHARSSPSIHPSIHPSIPVPGSPPRLTHHALQPLACPRAATRSAPPAMQPGAGKRRQPIAGHLLGGPGTPSRGGVVCLSVWFVLSCLVLVGGGAEQFVLDSPSTA